jgi:hypothetical protein
MIQKITKGLILMFVLVGLLFTVFNFIPVAKASEVIWGELNWITNPEPWMEKYHVGDTGYYCLGIPSDCCIVIEV